MLLRVRSKEGMKRIEVVPEDTFETLARKAAAEFKLNGPESIQFKIKGNFVLFPATVASEDLKHGDIVDAEFTGTSNSNDPPEDPAASQSNVSQSNVSKILPLANVAAIKQDAVDDLLEKERGLIKRGRDTNFCRHGSDSMCDYCMPLEPSNLEYLEKNKIKHMSFHAYLRKLRTEQQTTSSTAGNQTLLPPLEEPDFKIKVPCTGGHAPWPEGICTKCQPSAITLQRQSYRMVDHVEFSTPSIIENFISFWRGSGCQRFGYLYGRYEPYPDVPLGVKAVVEAIYEPPQENHVDGLELKQCGSGGREETLWDSETDVDEVAKACGLVRVGMIFTDLIDDGSGTGKVVAKRHIDSYFLSSLECSFAAKMQYRHPNPSRSSVSGKFSSKFVTCVISGDVEGDIHVTVYQVSDTMTAMQDADIVEPCRKPSAMRVKESVSHERYVPDIFYKFKNEYGVMVQKTAKSVFPVEYLLVNVTNGFPHTPSPLFTPDTMFPIENREADYQQMIGRLGTLLESATTVAEKKKLLSDFHLLCFIRSTSIVQQDDFVQVCRSVTQDDQAAEQLERLESWETLVMVAKEAAKGSAPGASAATATIEKTCRHCTFDNINGGSSCEMCGLPLDE